MKRRVVKSLQIAVCVLLIIFAAMIFIIIIPSDNPFDFPQSEWKSLDGKMSIAIDEAQGDYGIAHYGALFYDDGSFTKIYDLYEGLANLVMLYNENEYCRERAHDNLGSFHVLYGNKKFCIVNFSFRSESCPPNFGNKPRLIVFVRTGK